MAACILHRLKPFKFFLDVKHWDLANGTDNLAAKSSRDSKVNRLLPGIQMSPNMTLALFFTKMHLDEFIASF